MPLFVVSEIRKVKISAAVPESDLHNLKPNQKTRVRIAALDSAFPGRIVEIGSAADPASRTFTVKIEVDNPGLRIRPGMTAEADIALEDSSLILSVPAEAVLHDLDHSTYVYVVDAAKGRAFRRDIAPGPGSAETKSRSSRACARTI